MQEKSMTLEDGRQLGYWTYGDPTGIPVLLFHGTPGSRVWFRSDDSQAKAMGIYLITTDRPGYGLSEFQKNRTILDWAIDIEELTTYLGLVSFSVLGVSGGGAFAAACAYAMPDRVQKTALVSSAAPFPEGKAPKDMAKENRRAFFLTKYFPWLMKRANLAQKKVLEKDPDKYIKSILKGNHPHLAEWDRALLKDEGLVELSLYHAKEAYRQGVEGVLYETNLLAKEWGFGVNEINGPVRIWHGEKDTLSPVGEMTKLAQQFPSCEVSLIPEGGHFLTENDELWKEMLAYLKDWKASVALT